MPQGIVTAYINFFLKKNNINTQYLDSVPLLISETKF